MAQTLNRIEAGEKAAGSGYRPLVREARLDDYQRIIELQARNGLVSRSYEDWSKLWTSNPACVRRDRPSQMGWVLAGPGGEIGGYLGNLALLYRLNGRNIHAATPYSWAVDPACRSYSLALLFQFLGQVGVDLFVCTTPNAIAERVLRAFKFSKVPSGRWDEAHFWITGFQGFAASALRAAPVPLPRVLAWPLAAGLYLGDAVRSCVGGISGPSRAAPYEFDLCTSFSDCFDAFWRELENENGHRLLAVRTRETLTWHFGGALAQGRVWILAIHKGSRLVAYAILDRQDHPVLQLRRLRLVDVRALRGFEGALGPALQWLLHKSRGEGIHVIENVGCWLDPFPAAVHRRRLQSWLFYYKTRNEELLEQLRNAGVWMPSAFDGDASL